MVKRYIEWYDELGTIPTVKKTQKLRLKDSAIEDGKYKTIGGAIIDIENPTYRKKEKFYYCVSNKAQSFLTEGQANNILSREVLDDIQENNMFMQLSRSEQRKTDWMLIILMTVIAIALCVAGYFGGVSTV